MGARALKVQVIRGVRGHAPPKILENIFAKIALTALSELLKRNFLEIYRGIRTELFWSLSGTKL